MSLEQPETGDEFVLRLLNVSDDDALHAIRAEALKLDAANYATTPLTLDEWCARFETDENCRIIGLFNQTKKELVGITAISPLEAAIPPEERLTPPWAGYTMDHAALFGSSYIKPAYRHVRYGGERLSDLLYAARVEVAKRIPLYERAMVNYRDGNTASEALNRKHGAKYKFNAPKKYTDGSTALGHWCEYILKP